MISKITTSICLLLGLFCSVASAQDSASSVSADGWDTENLLVLNSLGVSLIPSETTHAPPSIVGYFDDRNPAGLVTGFVSTVSLQKSMLIDAMLDAGGELSVTLTPLTLNEARNARPETQWTGWGEFWKAFVSDSIESKNSYNVAAETDGSFELHLDPDARVTINTSTVDDSGFYTFIKMYLSDQHAEFDELPKPVQRRISRLELPVVGNVAFQPEITRSKEGRQSIVRSEIKKGSYRGQTGYVDIDGRTWIRHRSLSDATKSWIILIDDGDQSVNVDNNGNKI